MATRYWTGLAYDGNIDNPLNWTLDNYGLEYGETICDNLIIDSHDMTSAPGYLTQGIWGTLSTPVKSFQITSRFLGNIGHSNMFMKINLVQSYSGNVGNIQEFSDWIYENHSINFEDFIYNPDLHYLAEDFFGKVSIDIGDSEGQGLRYCMVDCRDYYGNRYHNFDDRKIYCLNNLELIGKSYSNTICHFNGDYAVVDTSRFSSTPSYVQSSSADSINFTDCEIFNYHHYSYYNIGTTGVLFRWGPPGGNSFPVSQICDPYSNYDPYCNSRYLSLPNNGDERNDLGYSIGYIAGTVKTRLIAHVYDSSKLIIKCSGHFKDISIDGAAYVFLATSTTGSIGDNYLQVDSVRVSNPQSDQTSANNALSFGLTKVNINKLEIVAGSVSEYSATILPSFAPSVSNISNLIINGGAIKFRNTGFDWGLNVENLEFSPTISSYISSGQSSINEYIKFFSLYMPSSMADPEYTYYLIGNQEQEANEWSAYHAGAIALD